MGGRAAEARRNDARVLAAACAVFEELGDDAPVSAIARRAGVGMGSLYRRYPTKEVLLHDVCLDALQRIAGMVEAALAEDDAWDALERVLRVVVESGMTKLIGSQRAMASDDLRAAGERVGVALERLVRRAQQEGARQEGARQEGAQQEGARQEGARQECVLRDGVSAGDLFRLACMVAATEPGLRARYLALVLDGLRAPRPLPGAAPEWSF